MKRVFTILLTCILAASLLAGCGASKSKMETFYAKYNHLEMVLDGDVFDLYKSRYGGIKDAEIWGAYRFVWEDGICYAIDDEDQTVEVSEDEFFREIIYMDVEGLALTGSGKGEFEGKQLDYETFEDEDWKQTYYFDVDGGLKGYVIIDKEEPEEIYKSLEVLSYDNNVPAGVFDIPADYEVIEATEG